MHIISRPAAIAASLLLALLLQACATTSPPKAAVSIAPAETNTQEEDDKKTDIPTRPFPADSLHDLLVAEFAVKRNRFDLALGNYMQQAHETRDPGVTARATRLAQFLNADSAALDAALLWVDIEPDNLEAQYTAATLLAKARQPEAAIKHMRRVFEQGGQTNFPAIAASSLSMDEETRTVIESLFDQLLLSHPDNPQLLTSKALLLQKRQQNEQALDTIRQAIILAPDDLHAVVVEARLLQQLKRGDEAFQRLEQVVKQHPQNRRLRLQYARMLMTKDISLAKEQFKTLLVQTPNDADLILSVALISKENEQLDEASAYLERLLELGKRTSESHFYLGQIAEQRQQWEIAINHYRKILPGADFLSATSRITNIYLTQGRVETAKSYLQELRQQYPEHATRIYLMESEILLGSGHYEQGFKLLSEALVLYPQQTNLLYARSIFSEKLAKTDTMKQDLQTIIAMEPDNAAALNALGYAMANRSENLDLAYQYIAKAIRLKPNDPAIQDSLGWVEFRRGNLQQALDILAIAYKSFPDHEVAAHLGEVLWVMGRQQEAILIWRQALQRRPDSPVIAETLKRLTGAAALPDSNGEATPE